MRKDPPKVITHHWEEPNENFQRVHIDYAGPFQNHHFLVLVDAKSKWPEIRLIKDAPTSEKTITLLQNIFSTHGLPQIIVSDNATIFQSAMFKEYCSKNGISQKFIAPGHPATNGLAERYVQILKTKLKAMVNDILPLNIKIQEILFRYRATPLANGQTPSQLYLGRDLRIKLDAMRPVKEIKSTLRSPVVRNISVGDRVQVRWFGKNKPIWKFGTVKSKFGQLDNDYELKRHINQLYKSNVEVPKKSITFAEPPVKQKPNLDEVHIEHKVTNPVIQSIPPEESQLVATPEGSLRRSSRVRRPPTHLEGHVCY